MIGMWICQQRPDEKWHGSNYSATNRWCDCLNEQRKITSFEVSMTTLVSRNKPYISISTPCSQHSIAKQFSLVKKWPGGEETVMELVVFG